MKLGVHNKSQVLPDPKLGEIWQYALHETRHLPRKDKEGRYITVKNNHGKTVLNRFPYDYKTGQYKTLKVENQEDIQMIKEGFEAHCFRKVQSA